MVQFIWFLLFGLALNSQVGAIPSPQSIIGAQLTLSFDQVAPDGTVYSYDVQKDLTDQQKTYDIWSSFFNVPWRNDETTRGQFDVQDPDSSLSNFTPSLIFTHGARVRKMNFSADGNYLAIAGTSGGTPAATLRIFRFVDAATLTEITSIDHASGFQRDVQWRDNATLATTSDDGIQVYRFDGTSLRLLASATTISGEAHVRWSSDGKFIAYSNPTDLRVYAFNEDRLDLVGTYSGIVPRGVAWITDQLLAIFDTTTIQTITFNYHNLTLANSISVPAGSLYTGLEWGTSLAAPTAVIGTNATNVLIYTSALSLQKTVAITSASLYTVTWDIAWSPGRAYFSLVDSGTRLLECRVFGVDQFVTPVLTPFLGSIYLGSRIFSLSWSPDELFVLAGTTTQLFLNSFLETTTFLGYKAQQQYIALKTADPFNATIVGGKMRCPALMDVTGGRRTHNDGNAINALAWGVGPFNHVAVGSDHAITGSEVAVWNFDGTNTATSPTSSVFHGADVEALDWTRHGRYLAIGGAATGNGTTVRVAAYNGSTFPILSLLSGCNFAHGASILAVKWHPTENFLAVAGAASSGITARIFSFSSTALALTPLTVLSAGTQVNSLAWHPDGTFLALALNSGTVEIYSFNEATLTFVTSVAATASPMTEVHWHPYGNYISVTGAPSSGIAARVYKFNGTALTEQIDCRVADSATIYGGNWSPDGKRLIINSPGAKTVTVNRFAGGALVPIVSFTNGESGSVSYLTSWSPTARHIALGLGASFAGGNLHILEFIDDFDEQIRASNERVARARSNADYVTTLVENAPVIFPEGLNTIDHGPAHIHFASSSITLSYQLNISSNHTLRIHSSSVINGNGHAINFADQGTSIILDSGISVTLQNMTVKNFTESSVSLGSGSSLFFGNNTTVELGQSQNVVNPWRFAGYATLKGNGYTLRPGVDPAYVAVNQGGRLLFEDITIENMQDNNLRCLAADASLVFKNCHLALANDFSLTVGSVLFQGDVIISGTSEFSYRSSTSSSIDTNGRLILDTDAILTYSPGVSSKGLFFLTDSSSQLQLNGNTIRVSTAGWRLTKGRLLVEGKNSVASTATALSQAVELGDGVASDDLQISIMPGAALSLTSGFMNYLNVG